VCKKRKTAINAAGMKVWTEKLECENTNEFKENYRLVEKSGTVRPMTIIHLRNIHRH